MKPFHISSPIKKKQVKFFSKKTFLFPFKKQAEITKFSGGLRPPNPPQVSLKISLEPLRPRGGLVVFENKVISNLFLKY